jgi:NADPH2:quinone reductase
VSTDEKETQAKKAGADSVLRYDRFAKQVRELTDGSGVDVVFDGVGRITINGSLKSLRIRGTLVLFGNKASIPVTGIGLKPRGVGQVLGSPTA